MAAERAQQELVFDCRKADRQILGDLLSKATKPGIDIWCAANKVTSENINNCWVLHSEGFRVPFGSWVMKWYRNEVVCKVLKDNYGVDFNKEDSVGFTPLLRLAMEGDFNKINRLLELGVLNRSNINYTLLEPAMKGHTVMSYVLHNCKDINSDLLQQKISIIELLAANGGVAEGITAAEGFQEDIIHAYSKGVAVCLRKGANAGKDAFDTHTPQGGGMPQTLQLPCISQERRRVVDRLIPSCKAENIAVTTGPVEKRRRGGGSVGGLGS